MIGDWCEHFAQRVVVIDRYIPGYQAVKEKGCSLDGRQHHCGGVKSRCPLAGKAAKK